MIGAQTGKSIGYSVRSKFCNTCDESTRTGKTPKKHDCPMNWSGSAKAMEQNMIIEIMRKCNDSGASVDTIIVDDDTTTIAKIKQRVNPDIKKRSDSNALYSLRKKHKTLQNPKVFK